MRKDNWPKFFHATVEKRRTQPFQWGVNDCVVFAAACVESITDKNPIEDLEPWTTEREAKKRIAEVGGFEAWLDKHYERVEWFNARRGDLGVLEQKNGPILVVNVGPSWVGPSDEGLTPSPPNAVKAAWRVE